jgi:hypothetical protein
METQPLLSKAEWCKEIYPSQKAEPKGIWTGNSISTMIVNTDMKCQREFKQSLKLWHQDSLV